MSTPDPWLRPWHFSSEEAVTDRLRLRRLDVEAVRVLAVAGFLDHVGARGFEERLVGLLEVDLPLVLDLSELSGVTPAGAGSLVAAVERATSKGRDVAVVRPLRPVLGVVDTLEVMNVVLVRSIGEALDRA